MSTAPLGWPAIVRLGLVQSALGAVVMLTTSLLNRVMIVEYGLAAAIPAGLVAWHYVVQLSRPRWGHGSDSGGLRTPWIIGGVGVLALGALAATNAAMMMAAWPVTGLLLGIVAFTMIGAGVGAAGTSLLALLASEVAPERRAAAAATTWIMMIAGIVVTAGVAGSLIDPFSPARLANIAGGIALAAFLTTVLAVRGVERPGRRIASADAPPDFRAAIADIWQDAAARRFTLFVFVSMLAYSTQDLILEPFAGLVFAYTPGQSTSLSGLQHLGVLAGMVTTGWLGRRHGGMRVWIVGGCLASALALAGLAAGATAGPGWPLKANILLLGAANGVFAVAAIAAMMELAGANGGGSEGIRMGLWGAGQAIAFALGGFMGAVGLDVGRALLGSTPQAFLVVFTVEAVLFGLAAGLATRFPSPLPFRGGAGGGGSPRTPALVDSPHPNPSPEGEGLFSRSAA